MIILSISFLAYLIDCLHGEFKSITHPVVYIGKYISWFEKRFYKPTFTRGFLLVLSLLSVTIVFLYALEYILSLLPYYVSFIVTAIIASMFLAHHMLYHSVLEVVSAPNPKEKIKYLVSRDAEQMDEHEVYKACIETYTENINDGVIAPLFYLVLFGLKGLIIFKVISTLDSMVGYKNERYRDYGTVGARLDDIAGWIPARISAFLIYVITKSTYGYKKLKEYATGHESPNSGWPIAAAGLGFHLKLGGPTRYFGKMKNKPYLGDGEKPLTKEDVLKVLSLRKSIDIFVLLFLAITTILLWSII